MAVFTLARNESLFLPMWIDYYSNYFDYHDMFILDHQSTDDSTKNLPCAVTKVVHEYVHDDIFMNTVITEFQMKLLEKYDYVLYVDTDEFVYHKDGLDMYIGSLESPCVITNGYEIVHIRSKEKPLDRSLPILKQRSFWIHSKMYSKPILSAIPMQWSVGRHTSKNGCLLDENLFLLHLKRVDYDLALMKNKSTAQSNISPINIENGWGRQCWFTGVEFDQWFENDFYEENYSDAFIELIPDHIKNFMPL